MRQSICCRLFYARADKFGHNCFKTDDMKKIVLFLITALLAFGCSQKIVPIKSEKTDSIRIEHTVEYVEKFRTDTVKIEIPAQEKQVQVRDSSSHLETDFATSDARVYSDGTLYHSLRNKARTVPVAVQIKEVEKIVTRDSLVYRDTRIEVPVRLPLTWRETFWVRSGQIGWAALILVIAVFVLRKFR